ncbi:hypothetical protein JCM10908_004907 [Rhodotorula pacifica]|uniref:uncharacterized protein n=1 Tax=Rhodotorula pacifica TaxID=1495444 RepID=UPI003174B348
MAKRGAEKQLTQDNVEEDERTENGGGEFAKASEQALAGRKIRGMPKRAGARAPAAATATADATKAPLFGASTSSNPFAALANASNPPPASAPAAAASPFSFGVAAAPASSKPDAANGSAAKAATPSFNFAPSTAAAAPSAPFSFSAPKPSTTTGAPTAPASFSFGGSGAFGSSSFGSSAFGSAPAAPVAAAASAPAPAAAATPAATKTERSQPPALTYFTSLRALNLSLIDTLTAAVEKDAFVDLAANGLLDKLRDKYVSYRSQVQSEYDASRGDAEAGSSDSKGIEVDAPAAAASKNPAFEVPEIFRNPPKPVPIADLSETGQQKSTSTTAAPKPFAPTVSENEIPAIFRNPPKPVPIADLSETGDKASSASTSSAPKAFAPTVSENEIPAIFRNPPKPVPIADLSETGEQGKETETTSSTGKSMAPTIDESEIPAIFRNPPKPVPIADLTEEKPEDAKKPPAPPAVFSFAGSTVKATAPAPSSTSSSNAPVAGGFVFKADATAKDPYAEKSSFSFPPAAAASSPTSPATAASASSSTSTPANSDASSKPSTTASSSSRDELKPPSAPKLAPAKLTNPPAKPSPLRFGQSASPPTSPEKPDEAAASKPKTGFSFGAQFGGIAKGDAAKKSEDTKNATSEAAAAAPKPAFSFGSASTSSPFSFGSASTAPSTGTTSGFSFGAATSTPAPAASATSSAPAASKPIPFTFGAANPFSSSSTGGFGAANAGSPGASGSPPASFGFGAALQGGDAGKARSAGFGFGSGIGSPTASGAAPATTTLSEKDQPAKATFGFSFGAANTPAASSTSAPAAPAAAPASDFSFMPSGPSIVNRDASNNNGGDSTAPSEAATDSRAQTPGANPFTGLGEGEEGEEVLHASRCKVYRIEGGNSKDLGIANAQLKEKEGKVRMLARNETNGKVVVNFSLYPSLTLKREKIFLTFLGFDENAKPTTYRLKFKTVEIVEEFEEAVNDAKKKLAS